MSFFNSFVSLNFEYTAEIQIDRQTDRQTDRQIIFIYSRTIH